jgi:hypothetical protein
MPLCRERCWLGSDVVDLSVEFVLGGVVSLSLRIQLYAKTPCLSILFEK